MSENIKKNKKIHIISKKILSWFFGSFMLLLALLIFFENILASTLGFFCALISIPPTGKLINQFLQSKYHFIIEGRLKAAVCFVLFVFVTTAIPEKSRQNLANTEQQQSSVSSLGTQDIVIVENQQSKPNKSNVVVKNLIVKKFDDKFRYFFDIRNKGTEDFNGEVSIYLHNNKQSLELGRDNFKTKYPINPKLGNNVWIEINTGPQIIHGEFGITKFKYEVKVDNIIIKSEEDFITAKYEDLSR